RPRGAFPPRTGPHPLVRPGQTHDPRGDVDGDPADVAVPELDLAGVHGRSDLEVAADGWALGPSGVQDRQDILHGVLEDHRSVTEHAIGDVDTAAVDIPNFGTSHRATTNAAIRRTYQLHRVAWMAGLSIERRGRHARARLAPSQGSVPAGSGPART